MRLPAILFVLLAAGCASAPSGTVALPSPGQSEATPTSSPQSFPGTEQPKAFTLTGSGTFKSTGTEARTYDKKLVPEGAEATATVESADGATMSTLTVKGLAPSRPYGIHLHAKPCGDKPDDSGPHFQHTPGHADAENEVWLDLTTDASGNGTADARQSWMLTPEHFPKSLVIHAEPTETAGTNAGMAGARAACLALTKKK